MADADAIIVGAGPGGLAAALALAERGRSVIVTERKPRDQFGKKIKVSVERGIFSELSLPAPEPPEFKEPPMAREFFSPDRSCKLRFRDLPLITIDLRSTLSRMIELAETRGARFLFETTITGPITRSGRVTGVVGTSADERLLELSAPLCVDASGIFGALRHHLDDDFGIIREIDPLDVCNAWQESREIDREAVMELLSQNRIQPQVNVTRLGFMGPYSMLSVYVDLENDLADITVGVQHNPAYPTAREILQGYVEAHHWIKEPVSGGGGLIPVRRPLDSFVADGFACVGDAACQAIPQHASGVSSALAAGRMLGEVAAHALENGDATRDWLWPYNLRYMLDRGATQANSDLFRRFLLGLTIEELSMLFRRGLVTEQAVKGSLEGMALELPFSAVLSTALGMWKRPGLMRRMARLSRDSVKVLDTYNAYPEHYDPDDLAKWSRAAQKVFSRWRSKGPEAGPD